ncbi:MAG: 30S ribosomal protein S12 methylthiotransferase RimO [Bacteroidales bacterium]|nr:30S ribosomal protein S12 methylthiotransferase RimO [Bacteroidales bacterium]
MKVDIISLGCSKNLVDSERLTKRLENLGHKVFFEPKNPTGKIVIINTCGFIGDAKEESINTILEAVQLKNEGVYKQVYVMGCLSERYKNELPAEISEVDKWYGKFDWDKIVDESRNWDMKNTDKYTPYPVYDKIVSTPAHYTYLKIAEGCNRFCAFCAIPLITGRFHSRPIEEIADEVKLLVSRGVKEFNVIAQDLSSYGIDLYGEMKLPELIETLAQIPGVHWLRLHYAYPAQFPYGILDVMAKYPNVCHYLDIALQHISDKVLTNMRRHITGEQTRELIKTLRQQVPDIHIRTTLMVGFPGEGEEEFNELLDFVKEARFERMGAFAYCEEEDTFGAKNYTDDIPEDVKQQRLDKLMALQEEISTEIQESKVGSIQKVIIDGTEGDMYVGRTQYDSPEVDPVVLIKSERPLNTGEFYDVKITSAMPFELMGEIIN